MPTPSGRMSRTASKTTQGTPIWCSVKAVASPPMPPPAMITGRSVTQLDAGQADVRHRQALHQHPHEGPVEVVPAGIRGLVELVGRYRNDLGVRHHRDVRAAPLPLLLQVGH